MAAQVETAVPSPPPPPPSTALTQEDRDRLLEFDKIVKFRDIVTSGKHARVKIPAHLVRFARTASVDPILSAAAAQRPANSSDAPIQRITEERNSLAHKENSELASTWPASTSRSTLPGLGYAVEGGRAGKERQAGGQESFAAGVVKKCPTFDPVLLEKSDCYMRAEFSLKRARLEMRLGNLADSAKADEDQAPGLVLDDVLRRARELERTFTPPHGGLLAEEINLGDGAKAGGQSGGGRGEEDSADDGTFYSSKFSTPEFGLKSRVPAASDNGPDRGTRSRGSSSDYEPEIGDGNSFLTGTSQPPMSSGQQLVQGYALSLAQAQAHVLAQVPSPIAQGNATLWSGANQQWESSLSGISREVQSTNSGPLSSGGSSYQRQPVEDDPRPPSPFIRRAHDLSPVAPQPSNASSLAAVAAVAQLPLSASASGQQQQQQLFYDRPSAPAQVTMLRRDEVEISQSSAESSQPDGSSRTHDKKKGKKRAANKRKADLHTASPHIKAEPRSESPVHMPSMQRPHKRQRQAVRRSQDSGRPRHNAQYSPTLHQTTSTNNRGVYHFTLPVRDDPMPIVYEGRASEQHHGGLPRARGMVRAADLQPYPQRQRAYEVYETVPASHEPVYAQPARPPSVDGEYIPAARLPRQSLVEAPSGDYASRAVYGDLGGGGSVGYQYEPSRRIVAHAGHSGVVREQSTSPVLMAPPPASFVAYRRQSPPSPRPVQGRIVADEFGREYYEPARPYVPGAGTAAATTSDTVALHPRYGTDAVPDRPMSRQRYVLPPQQRLPARAVSQMPPVLYEERSQGGYGGASPVFVAPARRVLTQPEYVMQDTLPPDYRREYSVVRVSQPPQPLQPSQPPPYFAAGTSHPHPVDEFSARRDYHSHMARASTAVPHDAYKEYETMPAASGLYAERVGSVCMPGATGEVTHSRGHLRDQRPMVAPVDGRAYYMGGGGGGGGVGGVHGPYDTRHRASREFSIRPEQAVVLPRGMSVLPGPVPEQQHYYVEQTVPSGGAPPATSGYNVYSEDRSALYR